MDEMIEKELEQDILEYARRRYHNEKRQLLDLLEIKEREKEELRAVIRDFEAKTEALNARLDEERMGRAGFLFKQESEMEVLRAQADKDRQVMAQETRLQQETIERLNAQIAEYKGEIKKLFEENQRRLRAFGEEIRQKEAEIEKLKLREKELEAKVLTIESAAKNEAGRLAQKVLELEEFLAREKQARVKLEESSKEALSASTRALLEERSKAQVFEGRLGELSRAVEKLEAEKTKILENWDRERKKWEELWERERKVWENQRAGFADWEAKYMKEKAQWEKMISEKEEKEIRLTKVFGNLVSELSRWGHALRGAGEEKFESGRREAMGGGGLGPSPMPPNFPQMEEGVGVPSTGQLKASTPTPFDFAQGRLSSPIEWEGGRRRGKGGAKTFFRRHAFWLGGTAVAAVIGLGFLIFARSFWINRKPIIYFETLSWELPVSTPSGIALGEEKGKDDFLWITDWKTGDMVQVYLDNPAKIVSRFASGMTFFHPNSIAASPDGKHLFTLDSISRKIFKHNAANPGAVIEEVPTPTASCLFLAVIEDTKHGTEPPTLPSPTGGEGLSGGEWSLAVLDTIQKDIYFFDPKTLKAKPVSAFKLPQDVIPLVFTASGSVVWILDGKSLALLPFQKDSEGRWKKGRPVKIALTAGMETPANAAAVLVQGDKTIYLAIETDPPRLIQARP
ncbi:MAG: hypothetical protein HY747_02675 [Elusimicrobia bacterium]|nr:hypothetical protein [Elusimicrobiota bacterium]